jgi:hypothetical protein
MTVKDEKSKNTGPIPKMVLRIGKIKEMNTLAPILEKVARAIPFAVKISAL